MFPCWLISDVMTLLTADFSGSAWLAPEASNSTSTSHAAEDTASSSSLRVARRAARSPACSACILWRLRRQLPAPVASNFSHADRHFIAAGLQVLSSRPARTASTIAKTSMAWGTMAISVFWRLLRSSASASSATVVSSSTATARFAPEAARERACWTRLRDASSPESTAVAATTRATREATSCATAGSAIRARSRSLTTDCMCERYSWGRLPHCSRIFFKSVLAA
mmetsp:Transcript_29773/g.83900  ORF Transcript_29773/g.83900 Transcript_29773/m.83900 type:complete len:226 (+) Transcript_29773:665-1342(+)